MVGRFGVRYYKGASATGCPVRQPSLSCFCRLKRPCYIQGDDKNVGGVVLFHLSVVLRHAIDSGVDREGN